MEPKREHTIKLRFGAQAKNPNNAEIFKFFTKQEWTNEDLSAMYRDDYCICVRFKTEDLMRAALTKLGPQVKFVYDDGTSMEVPVTAAAGSFKYVRIFGLPPEVEDKYIATAMSKYGTVQQLVRERFPVDTGFPIWNGVRGVHIEVVSEIPAQLTIQHVKARIYYDGLQNKCFGCGALDHLKANCPKRKTVNGRLATSSKGDGSFASVVANGASGIADELPTTSGMVVLKKTVSTPEAGTSNGETKGTPVGQSPAEVAPATDPPKLALTEEPKKNEGTPEGKEDQMEQDDEWVEAKGKGKGKRGRPQKTPESDSSESDARGGKQFIVPGQNPDLLEAMGQRTRSRSRSEQKTPTTTQVN